MRRHTVTSLASLAFLMSPLPLAYAQGSGAALNQWTRTADLTTPRDQACAAVLKDGRLLVAGGLGDSGPVAGVDIYDADGTFLAGPPMSGARTRAACVTLDDGRVLVAGGDDGTGALSTAEIFDPSQNQWAPTGSLSVAREGHKMALVPWGGVWVVGGTNNGAIVGTLEMFGGDGKFRSVGALNTARTEFAMTPVGTRNLLVAGGTDGTTTLDSVEIYDGILGKITVAGRMSTPRKGFAVAALLDGTVLMTGGIDINGSTLATTEIFDPVQGTSAPGPALLAPRANHFAYAMPDNGSVLVYGGTGSSTVLGSTEIFKPWMGTFAQGSPINVARRDEARATLRQGSFMVAGGRNGSGFLSSSELFQFSTVATDKLDYAPGTQVKISGTGWVPGEQVLVQITAFPLDQHHVEFTGSAVADGSGKISLSGFAVDMSHLHMKFLMTATGSQSEAQAFFTDSVDPVITFTFNPASDAAPGSNIDVTVAVSPNPSTPSDIPDGLIIPCTNNTCPTGIDDYGGQRIYRVRPGRRMYAGGGAVVEHVRIYPARHPGRGHHVRRGIQRQQRLQLQSGSAESEQLELFGAELHYNGPHQRAERQHSIRFADTVCRDGLYFG